MEEALRLGLWPQQWIHQDCILPNPGDEVWKGLLNESLLHTQLMSSMAPKTQSDECILNDLHAHFRAIRGPIL